MCVCVLGVGGGVGGGIKILSEILDFSIEIKYRKMSHCQSNLVCSLIIMYTQILDGQHVFYKDNFYS